MNYDHLRAKIIIAVFLLLATCVKGQGPPKLKVTVADSGRKGYYFFSPVKIRTTGNSLPIIILLDAKGKYVYYKKFNKGPFAGSFKLQPNGTASYYFDNRFFILKDNFEIIDTVRCVNRVKQDPHDLVILPDGHYLMLGMETKTMNLSRYKFFHKGKSYGDKNAKVICNVIQELDTSKKLVFEWHGKDHYRFDDVDTSFLSDPVNVDWMHANAVERDTDGNYLISVRNFNEITKVSGTDGKILWRLGGKRNQFTLENDSCVFYGQHDIRRTARGTLTLFDNGRKGKKVKPEGAKEFILDEQNLKAELVWSHINNPKAWSAGYGNVQRLDDGYTLINYGRSDKANIIFNVLDPHGKKVFEVSTRDTMVNYRAFYYPDLPFKITRPKVSSNYRDGQLFLEAEGGHARYKWSNGLKTQSVRITKPGEYQVFVPSGNKGFMASEPFIVTPADLKMAPN